MLLRDRVRRTILTLFLSAGGPASANGYFVPQDFPTIQAAINAAVDGDFVIVMSGTYSERLDTLGKRIRINGVAVNPPTIVGTPGGPVLRVRAIAGQVGEVEIMNLTIRDGDAPLGGGIQVDAGARLHMLRSRLWGNEAVNGGAMVVGVNASVLIRECDFWQNSASGDGGAIYALSGANVRIEGTVFEANSATDDGGALWMGTGDLELVTGVRFHQNTAGDVGGGVALGPGARFVAAASDFDRNSAGGSGGGAGLFAENASVETARCLFEANTTTGAGGGMRLLGGATAVSVSDRFYDNEASSGGAVQASNASFIANVGQFIGNRAHQNGGAISSTGGSSSSNVLRVYNSRLNDNFAGLDGGAINLSYSSVSTVVAAEFLLANSMVHNNHSDSGVGGIQLTPFLLGGGNIRPTIVNSVIAGNSGANATNGLRVGIVAAQVHNSILWNNQGAELAVTPGSSVTRSIFDTAGAWPGAGNINANPLFRNAATGDFSLRSGSPAIDAGDNTRVPDDLVDDDNDGITAERLPLDFPGWARFHNDPATADTGVAGPGGGPVVDIGAFEFTRTCLADFAEPLGSVDFFDVTAFLAAFNARSPSADLAPPAGVWNFFDVSAFLGAFNSGCP